MDLRIDVGIDRGLGEGRSSCRTSAIMYRLRLGGVALVCKEWGLTRCFSNVQSEKCDYGDR